MIQKKVKNPSVGISISKGCNSTYNPSEKILISCITTADCSMELKLAYPDRRSSLLISNQVLRKGKTIVLERKVPSQPGTYVLTLYGRTPFGTSQDSCSFICESVGSLWVDSSIKDADVYVNSVYYGSTPVHIDNALPGTYEINVIKTGYCEWKSEVVVEQGLGTRVFANLKEIQEKSAELGYVYIRSEPLGADVYLDGNPKGVTPLLMETIPEGIHTIKMTKNGFRDFTQEISVIPGKPTLVSASLIRGHGSIQILTSISGAKVYLDDECEGIAPLTLYNIPEGDHEVALAKWGYDIWSSPVSVRANESVIIHPAVSLLWIWYILAFIAMPFYKLRKALRNLIEGRRGLPAYVPEFATSSIGAASEIVSESVLELEKKPPECPICNQRIFAHTESVLECSYCENVGFSCQFHKSCWMKWLEQTKGKRKCIMYPAIVSIPSHKIRLLTKV